MPYQSRQPPFLNVPNVVFTIVCWWFWKELVCWWWYENADLEMDRVTANARSDYHWQSQPRAIVSVLCLAVLVHGHTLWLTCKSNEWMNEWINEWMNDSLMCGRYRWVWDEWLVPPLSSQFHSYQRLCIGIKLKPNAWRHACEQLAQSPCMMLVWPESILQPLEIRSTLDVYAASCQCDKQ